MDNVGKTGRQSAQLNQRLRGLKRLVDLKKVKGRAGTVMPAGQVGRAWRRFNQVQEFGLHPSHPSHILSGSIGWEGLGPVASAFVTDAA